MITHACTVDHVRLAERYRPVNVKGANLVSTIAEAYQDRVRRALALARRTRRATSVRVISPVPPHPPRVLHCIPGRRPADVMVAVYAPREAVQIPETMNGTE